MRVIGRYRSKKGERKDWKCSQEKDFSLKSTSQSPSKSPNVWGLEDGVGLFPSTNTFSNQPGTSQRYLDPVAVTPAKKIRPSALPVENRFVPQHEPRKGHSPVEVIGSAALQFVPSYEESTFPEDRAVPKVTPSPKNYVSSDKKKKQQFNTKQDETPWDAVIEADDSSKEEIRGKGAKEKGSRRGVRKSLEKSFDSISSASDKLKCRSNAFLGNRQRRSNVSNKVTSPPKIITSKRGEEEIVSTISESTTAAKQRGKRIARLASMFTSRYNTTTKEELSLGPVRSGTTKQAAVREKKNLNIPPPSPSHSHVSSSSSGYANWPGTQDKRGKTVAVESSYDDSSVGASAFHRKQFELEAVNNIGLENLVTWKNNRPDPSGERNNDQRNSSQNNDQNDDNDTADFHLAAIVADVSAKNNRNPPSTNNRSGASTITTKDRSYYCKSGRTSTYNKAGENSVAETSASGALSIHNLFTNGTMEAENKRILPLYAKDPWDIDNSDMPPSSPGTSVSKDSSAFFQVDENGDVIEFRDPYYQYGIRRNVRDAESIIRRKPTQSPTHEALAAQNHFSPPHRTYNAHNIPGYRGFIDKTKDFPNLMDDEIDSDSIATSIENSTVTSDVVGQTLIRPNKLNSYKIKTRGSALSRQEIDEESDVFDGLSSNNKFSSNNALFNTSLLRNQKVNEVTRFKENSQNEGNMFSTPAAASTNLALNQRFERENGSDQFNSNTSGNDINQDEFFERMRTQNNNSQRVNKNKISRIPEGPPTLIRQIISNDRIRADQVNPKTLSATFKNEDISDIYEGSSISQYTHSNDLSRYCLHPSLSKKLVHAYRSFVVKAGGIESKDDEDAKKAFALSEMRSRIMEKDLERGLERKGGTTMVDDIILTPYHQAAYRVRDAVIVSKAWRDGSSPNDVMTAYNMTRRHERTYYVKRLARLGHPSQLRNKTSIASSFLGKNKTRVYTLEKVQWLDDTDFMQTRCPSMGARNMRGFEMFTIGDCQSILLKLTNEQCIRLRSELNTATSQQIEAEEKMKEEGDVGDGIMTEAEFQYLSTMESVKTISKQLIIAEKAFNLVRGRIQQLVARYESMLIKIENESIATASVVTCESSYYSDDYGSEYTSEEDEKERQIFQKRARRAELRAELAAREALMAKQQAKKICDEKQREIEILNQRLAELQSDSSCQEQMQPFNLAKVFAQSHSNPAAKDICQIPSPSRIDDAKINDIKQKFRDRMIERMRSKSFGGSSGNSSELNVSTELKNDMDQRNPNQKVRSIGPLRSQRRALVGEEMFQHLDFYERSLKAVDKPLQQYS